MDFKVNIENNLDSNLTVDRIKFRKMLLLYNALEDGWSLKKRSDSYVFTKNHEGKKEVLHESYLLNFMKSNLNVDSILK